MLLIFVARGKANDPTPSGVISDALNQSEPPRFLESSSSLEKRVIHIGYLTVPVIGREAKFHLFRNHMKFY